MTNQETVNEKRKEYMANSISHQDHYLWLAGFIGANAKMIPVPAERVKASTDDSFNDIPLKLWDNRDPLLRQLAYSKGIAWSLSDTVCVLKALARQVKEQA